MSSDFEQLQGIGIQKIHEQTHISREHVQSLLYGSFEGFTKIQFLGFISILQREYGLKLDDLKAKGLEYFEQNGEESDEKKIFVVAKKKKSYKTIYIAVFVILVSFGAFYSVVSSSKGVSEMEQSVAVEPKNDMVDIEMPPLEENNTQSQKIIEDENITVAKEVIENKEKKEDIDSLDEPQIKATLPSDLKIITKTKLWIGYTDLSNNKKYQKLFSGELDLNGSKEWLLLLGHGYVDIEANGELQSFKTKKNLRFVYRDSTLKKITTKEFKAISKGNR